MGKPCSVLGVLTAISLAVGVGACDTIERQDAPGGTVAVREAIREQSAAHVDAWLANDAARAAAVYADDAVLLFPDIADVSGRAAIEDYLGEVFGMLRVDSLEVSIDTIEVHGSVAYEWGNYHEVYTMTDGRTVAVDGRYVVRWQRQADGSWAISRFAGNTISQREGTVTASR